MRNKKSLVVVGLVTLVLVKCLRGNSHKDIVYGRFIDQNENPVGNVTIHVDHGYSAAFGFHTGNPRVDKPFFIADTDGNFQLETTGGRIGLNTIAHPDLARLFVRTGGSKKHSSYLYANKIEFGSEYFTNPDREGQSIDNPFVVNVWRFDKLGTANVVLNENGNASIAVKPDQAPVERFGLLFSCSLSKSAEPEEKRWSFRIEPVDNGGFQRATDDYLNEAPEQGYDVPALQFRNWTEKSEVIDAGHPTRYDMIYYNSDHKKTYGVFHIHDLRPFWGRRPGCHIVLTTIQYTDDGSRNLVVAPNMDIWR